MGLFGYNEKTFHKNTLLFKQELAELQNKVALAYMLEQTEDERTREPCRLLEQIIEELGYMRYPRGAEGKDLEAIDKRIRVLIEKIREEIESQKYATADELANMLLSAVVDARANGKERYTPEELQDAEERAQMLGEMNEMLVRREAIEKERAQLIEQCVGLDKTSAKYAMSHRKWKELGVELDTINGDLTEYEKAYNVRVNMLNMKNSATRANALRNLTNLNPEDFKHILEEHAQAYEAIFGERNVGTQGIEGAGGEFDITE